MADDKQQLRQILRECRRSLTAQYVAATAEAVQTRLMRSAYYRDAATVVLYAATENEVSAALLFGDALRSGRRVLMPRTNWHSRELLLAPVTGFADLQPAAFGILEPNGTDIVEPEELDSALICVPGVAFSRRGQRLGRGGGFYDKLLASIHRPVVTAGLAYSFQMLDRLPESPSDRRLDLIVTESAMHVMGDAVKPNRVCLSL